MSAADPAGHLTRLHYDRFGRLTEYRHDALGQVTEVIRHPLPGSGEVPLVTAFEYDVLGRLTARETADHRTEYRHDTLSLEIRRATRAEWRSALLEEHEPQWDAVLVFTRNAAGELVSEENHGGKFEYEYDALGNVSSTRSWRRCATAPVTCWRCSCVTAGRRTRWRLTVATVCAVKSPAARACSHRRRTTTPQGASRSARCWTPVGSWCSSAATGGTAPTR
ncbi:hypothetical protein ACN5LM_003836 [Cronobacter dublinensis]